MGSVAPMKRSADYGSRVLLAIQEHAQERATAGKESDEGYVCRLLSDAVDNPSSRESTLLALAAYLSQALIGIFPDL